MKQAAFIVRAAGDAVCVGPSSWADMAHRVQALPTMLLVLMPLATHDGVDMLRRPAASLVEPEP